MFECAVDDPKKSDHLLALGSKYGNFNLIIFIT